MLDREMARYLAGEISVEQALQNIHDGWEEITEEFGRDEQLQAVQGFARHHQLSGDRHIGERPERRHRLASAGARMPRPSRRAIGPRRAAGRVARPAVTRGCSSCPP